MCKWQYGPDKSQCIMPYNLIQLETTLVQRLPWTPTSGKKFGGLTQRLAQTYRGHKAIVANLDLTINWHKASMDLTRSPGQSEPG